MAGDTPFRKRRLRRKRSSEAYQGGTGPAEGVTAPAERSALPPSPGERDDERGRPASLEEVIAAIEEVDAAYGAGQVDRTEPVTGAGRLSSVKRGVRKGGESAKAAIGHIADLIIENAPRVPVRDLATLRKQFPGLGPEELADKLIAGASKGTATVGAGIGAAAMLPVPPAMLAELAAEITGVAAIEMKLVAELHEVYGLRPPGGLGQRSTAYLTSWTEERGIDVAHPTTLNAALGGQMKRELRQQIMKRMVRDVPNLIPFMIGAAVGAMMNRRDTRKVAERVRKDLRKRQIPWDRLPELPPLERQLGPHRAVPGELEP
ncbi:EcsC family protein [Streptomyces sp. NBC_00257]|uniref:EcsC family protein n=1 Tax=Streptomyces TaxID=1883 RepID=UPI0021A71DE0|nr:MULTISPECIES: EcsC family protein [Streptomyces]MCT2547528.1 EcsC family protein [Streptomyces atratus]MCX5428451.1 EcsC family protein [Streptomyces sp. NBC_00062]